MKLTVVLLLFSCTCLGQTRLVIDGRVFDAQTKEPLPFATIGVKGKVEEAISRSDGSFELRVPDTYLDDTLTVSYLGYIPFLKKISALHLPEDIYLEESYIMLQEVVVAHAELNFRDVDRALLPIRDNLYAMKTEVTNAQYNLFLGSLEEQYLTQLRKRCGYDLSGYDNPTQAFFKKYVTPYRESRNKKDTLNVNHDRYPAVNISHEAAVQYCEWLTEKYSARTGKKKFSKVKFRLPTIAEWQIAALGYEKFQTWNLEDNVVDVIVSEDSMSMAPRRGEKRSIRVGNDVWYPWFVSFYYRRSPRNHMGCFLGNFRIEYVEQPCPANNPGYDGWSMMGQTASYFPNDMGFYDVVGNVAEMIDEKGKACGGSWNDIPSESTIHSVKVYNRPDATIGFRVFMEVVE